MIHKYDREIVKERCTQQAIINKLRRQIAKSNSCIFFIFVCLVVFGCQAQKNIRENTRYVSELRGYIKADKEQYKVGEDIVVSYVLTNVSATLHQEPITNGSRNPQEAFAAYSFNAHLKDDKLIHLDAKEFGKPISGALSLKPKDEKIFVKNVFIAGETKGTYILTFYLKWREVKEILFQPVSIKIYSENEEVEQIQDEKDPKLDAMIQNLVSDDREARTIAKEQLVEYGDSALVALVETMGSTNTQLRSEAMLLLIDMDKEALPHLVKGARHENPEIRMRSVYSLGEIDSIYSIATIRDALLNDPEKDIRVTAFRIIQDYIDTIAIPLMVMALEDKDVDMRRQVIEKLRFRTGENLNYNPEESESERKAAIQRWKDFAKEKYRGQ